MGYYGKRLLQDLVITAKGYNNKRLLQQIIITAKGYYSNGL